MKFNTQFSEHNDPISKEDEPSLTDQQYKQECDLNFIVNQYVKTGTPIPQSPVSYADLTSVEDYQDALLTVSTYKTAFELLPAEERERFEGKVEKYLEFIVNPANLKESYEKGYVDPGSIAQDVIDSFYTQPVNSPKTSDSPANVETVNQTAES